MPSSNKPIFIVYHVAILGIWEQILKEQLSLLETSGLGQASEKIYVQISGVADANQFFAIQQIFKPYSYFAKIQFKYFKKLEVYEFPSIQQTQRIASRNPSARVLYFHTKGVSHGIVTSGTNQSANGRWNSTEVLNLRQWRKFMEYHTIIKWRDCLTELERVDCCGTDWVKASKDNAFHFSGNFWWANASYLLRCQLKETNRYDCEFFIGTGNPHAKELKSSIKNPELKKYFTEAQLKAIQHTMALQPDTPIFPWWSHFYEDKYFMVTDNPSHDFALSQNQLPAAHYSAAATASKEEIHIVYHIGALGSWKEIVQEQLELLHKSGLGAASENIWINVAGTHVHYEQQFFDSTFKKYPFFYKMRFEYYSSLDVYEFPSIKKVQEIAKKNPTSKILYFHTKGASYPLKNFRPQELENLKQWRKVMEYFNISQWKDCLKALQSVDACGIEWGKTEPHKNSIFAGNFWWANASYINRCMLNERDRFDCEEFIGTANPHIKCFFNSGNNPRLKEYFTDVEIHRMAPPHAFFNLKMFDYRLYYLDKKYYMKKEDL